MRPASCAPESCACGLVWAVWAWLARGRGRGAPSLGHLRLADSPHAPSACRSACCHLEASSGVTAFPPSRSSSHPPPLGSWPARLLRSLLQVGAGAGGAGREVKGGLQRPHRRLHALSSFPRPRPAAAAAGLARHRTGRPVRPSGRRTSTSEAVRERRDATRGEATAAAWPRCATPATLRSELGVPFDGALRTLRWLRGLSTRASSERVAESGGERRRPTESGGDRRPAAQ